MVALAWDVRIGSIGITGTTLPIYGTLGVAALPGPSSIRVQWGGTDPTGTYAATVTWHAPLTSLPFPFPPLPPEYVGSFLAPGFFESRPYADGSYAIRVTGFFPDATQQVEVLNAFFDVSGTIGLDRIFAGRDDLVYGGSGNDTFRGGAGDDWMSGALGNDLLVGGAGDDVLTGGPNDPAGNDTLLGGDGRDVLEGNGGNDLLNGGNQDDVLVGGDGLDSLVGGNGADLLFGGVGNDRLLGDAGADTFVGGTGVDNLISAFDGAADWFLFEAPTEGTDRIANFESGVDKIALSWLSTADVGGRFVTNLTELAGTGVHIINTVADGRVWVDMNGEDPGGLYRIATLVGSPLLQLSDFLFSDDVVL